MIGVYLIFGFYACFVIYVIWELFKDKDER